MNVGMYVCMYVCVYLSVSSQYIYIDIHENIEGIHTYISIFKYNDIHIYLYSQIHVCIVNKGVANGMFKL